MFLRYHKDNCRLYKLSISFLALLFSFSLISFFMLEYHSSKIFFALMVPLYILCICMIYKKLVSGFRWAKFYVMSWVPLIIGAAVQPLELTGFYPLQFCNSPPIFNCDFMRDRINGNGFGRPCTVPTRESAVSCDSFAANKNYLIRPC